MALLGVVAALCCDWPAAACALSLAWATPGAEKTRPVTATINNTRVMFASSALVIVAQAMAQVGGGPTDRFYFRFVLEMFERPCYDWLSSPG